MNNPLDQALSILSSTGPEYRGGLSNHGQMAVEALIELGRSEAVLPWVEQYKPRLEAMPPKIQPVAENNWQSALGDIKRYADWHEFFYNQLATMPLGEVINTWVDRLSPGYIAAAMHGVIRTGHALRSVGRERTDERVDELAQGLAYWAARYQELPGSNLMEGSRHNQLQNLNPKLNQNTLSFDSAEKALKVIPVLPLDKRGPSALITNEVAELAGFPPFAETINYLNIDRDPAAVLTQITQGFALVFLANAEPTGSVITLVHALTGPYALRAMLPYLQTPVARKAVRFAWQAACALYCRFGIGLDVNESDLQIQISVDELIEKAVTTGDEHAIKFTQACVSEYKINKQNIYLAAANLSCRLLES